MRLVKTKDGTVQSCSWTLSLVHNIVTRTFKADNINFIIITIRLIYIGLHTEREREREREREGERESSLVHVHTDVCDVAMVTNEGSL